MWHLNRRSVALGVAIGLFFGLLVPVAQILFAAAAAVLLRANLPVAVLATLVTNPFTFAPIYVLAYRVGAALLGESIDETQASAVAGATVQLAPLLERWVDWLGTIGRPLITGLAAFAVVGAVVGFFAVHISWRIAVIARVRRRARAAAASGEG